MPDAAAADDLLAHALAAAAAFQDEARRHLERSLAGLGDESSVAAVYDTTGQVLGRVAEPLGELLADANLTAWLHGAGRGAGLVAARVPGFGFLTGGTTPPAPRPAPPFPEDPVGSLWLPLVAEAVAYLRGPEATETLDPAEWEMERETQRLLGRARARDLTLEAAGQLHEAVTEAVEDGLSFAQFRERLPARLATSALGVGRLENTFRTDTAHAYSGGWNRILDRPAVADLFPFEETLPISDSRLTPLCEVVAVSGLDGTGIFLRADPVWRRYQPPRHWRCRCGRRALTVEEAARRGIRYAQEWLALGRQPLPLPFVAEPPLPLPKGWVPPG